MKTNFFESLDFFFKGNSEAVALALDLFFLSELIDDLADKDVERSPEDIKLGFRKLLVDFPQNGFYRKFQAQISTMIASTYLMWLDSTVFEDGNREDKFIAFHIRNTTINIVHHFIFLAGGPEWAQEQGPNFWKLFSQQEKMQELIDELQTIGEEP
jgi:hypothetical protein